MKKYLIISTLAVFSMVLAVSFVSAQNFTFNNDLSVGTTGSDVVQLQTWLISNGFDIPAISSGAASKGFFGSQTKAAVAAYQNSVNLPAYGYFGPMTRGWINSNGNHGNSLTVTSPNGGETWQMGTTHNITWTSNGLSNQTVTINLEYPTPACALPTANPRCMIAVLAPRPIAKNVSISAGSFSWSVGNIYWDAGAVPGYVVDPTAEYMKVNDGQYKIQICTSNGSQCDDSNNSFTVTSNNTTGQSPVINGVDAPTTLTVGQTGTWTIRATDPLNGTLSYSILWGDEPGYANTGGTMTVPAVMQTNVFTHSYSSAGNYMVTFTVRNSAGLQVQESSSVQVTNGSTAGPLKITSPNGGEVWQSGTRHNITWTSPYYIRATTADLRLIPLAPVCSPGFACPAISLAPYSVATNIPINQNSISWLVGVYAPIGYIPQAPAYVPDGQYTIQICESGTGNCDMSDSTFTINSSPAPSASMYVTSPNGGESWPANSTHAITWNVSNMLGTTAKVNLYLGQLIQLPCAPPLPNIGSGQCGPQFKTQYVLDKNVSAFSTYNWIVATDINNMQIPAGSYAVEVCVAGSTTNCDMSSASFTITSSQTSSVPDINVISPNGGETMKIGSLSSISWRLDGPIQPQYRVLLILKSYNGTGGGVIGVYNPLSTGSSISWTVPSSLVTGDLLTSINPGSYYKVRAELYDGEPNTGYSFTVPPSTAKQLAYDESDNYFTITQ